MPRNDDTKALRIISGGQTGVDRAALDVALELGLPCGGTCPKGRRAEDGAIPDRYPLLESPDTEYLTRTERNVIDSDATLVLTDGPPNGGTALTVELAKRHGRPCCIIHVDSPDAGDRARTWLGAQDAETLNIAGPREGEARGIYARARGLLHQIMST